MYQLQVWKLLDSAMLLSVSLHGCRSLVVGEFSVIQWNEAFSRWHTLCWLSCKWWTSCHLRTVWFCTLIKATKEETPRTETERVRQRAHCERTCSRFKCENWEQRVNSKGEEKSILTVFFWPIISWKMRRRTHLEIYQGRFFVFNFFWTLLGNKRCRVQQTLPKANWWKDITRSSKVNKMRVKWKLIIVSLPASQ